MKTHETLTSLLLFIEAVITWSQDDCTQRQVEAAMKCAQENDPDNGAADDSVVSVSFDEEACRDLETAEKCIVRELSVCENKIVAELVTSMFETINTELPCGKLHSSPASPVSVVRIALLTAALAVAL